MSFEALAVEKLKTLSPERQREVLDFIEFLQAKEQRQSSETNEAKESINSEALKADWQAEPFFGIWRDREDMKDSTEWVKQVRQQQWNS